MPPRPDAQDGRPGRRLLPPDSLARRLVRRLLPAFFLLLVVDLLAGGFLAGALRPGAGLLQDLFWMMLLTQLLLVVLFVWVLVSGVRTELSSLRQLTQEIRERSIDDLQPLDTRALPTEIVPLVQHFNDLLARLNDAVQAQRRFIGQAAHQLRTPLAGLKLESELMLAQPLDEALRVRAERIKQAADRMIRMGEQLLVLARADHAARPQEAFVRLDLCEWMRRTGAQWLTRAGAQSVRLQLQAPQAPVWVDADPLLLGELLANLIDNALRHARPVQCIVLRVQANPPSISVEDDGPGIAPEDQSRVFEAFYRARDVQARGSGLGLAVVQEIARAHGAWTQVISRPRFAGTRIAVVFPGPWRGASLRPRSGHRDGEFPKDAA